jgi:amino acid adenylation domain-containing protein
VDVLRYRACKHPDAVAFTFLTDGEGRETDLTFAGLDARARAVAALLRRNASAGDRVLLMYPAGLDYIAGLFGCFYAGLIAVPAYPPRMTAVSRTHARLQGIAQDCRPALALGPSSLVTSLPDWLRGDPAFAGMRWISSEQSDADETCGEDAGTGTVAFLQYTSGSTGSPKGVMVTHANLLHNQTLLESAFVHERDKPIVGWLPMFHDTGLVGNILHPVYLGARCILMAPAAFLQRPLRWLEAISRYRGATSGGPNFAYDLCVRRTTPEERAGLDLSCWKTAFNGAEPVRPQTMEEFSEAFRVSGFRREAFTPCYGLAEATLLVSARPRDAGPVTLSCATDALERGYAVPSNGSATRLLAGCGRTAGDQTVLIVDPETTARCPDGKIGEIWISGSSVGSGYWNRPEQTRATFEAIPGGETGPRCLRTGDLGFFLDGDLFLTARMKDLIVLHGRNHSPQDIEWTAEQSDEKLRPSGSAAFSIDADGRERLVIVLEVQRRYKGVDTAEVAAAVRRTIALEHDVHVHAVVLVRQDSIPRTTSGKIQRHACKVAFLAGALQLAGAVAGREQDRDTAAFDGPAPLTGEALRRLPPGERAGALLAYLRTLCAQTAGLPLSEIDLERPPASLGLDSLMTAGIRARVEADLGVTLPLEIILEASAVTVWVQAIVDRLGLDSIQDRSPSPPEIAPVHRGDRVHPCGYGQRALWFLHQLAPHSSAYHIARAIRVGPGLDEEAVRRSLEILVDRHAALRTTFRLQGSDPVQRIGETALALRCEDASSWTEDEVRKHLVAEADRPFDLEHGPLLRVNLLRLASGEHVLLLALHHIVADLRSLAILYAEFGMVYAACAAGAEPVLPALPIEYTDFVYWQRDSLSGPEGLRLLHYWTDRLAGPLPVLNLPADRPRPAVQTFSGACIQAPIEPVAAERLRILCRDRGATLYCGLLAAFFALLYRFTGHEDLVVGSPTEGRDQPCLAGVVGYFVNPVPVRVRVSDSDPFEVLLDRVQRAVIPALRHAACPFALIVERLHPERLADRSPIFQAMLVMHDTLTNSHEMGELALSLPGGDLSLGGVLPMTPVALDRSGAQFDISLFAAQTHRGLATLFEYNTDLFDASTMQRFASAFRAVVAGLTTDPGRSIGALSLLNPEERHQIVYGWNETAVEYGDERRLHRLIEAQAARTPDAAALRMGAGVLTWAGLELRSAALAWRLRKLGVGPDTVVGISVPRSLEMVVGLLGILKAGGAYLPLDPSYPQELLRYMAGDSGVRVVLASGSTAAAFVGSGVTLIDTHDLLILPPESEVAPLPDFTTPANLAYVIYTSGSTGKPKGVMVSHHGIANRLLWMQETYRLTPRDRVLQKTPLSFDVSVWEVFWPLLAGATLVVADPEAHRDPQQIAALLERYGITILHFVPSMLRAFLDEVDVGEHRSLRLVVCSGEALPSALARRFLDRSRARLENLYGPTEASVDVTFRACSTDEAGDTVPIGRPIANTQMHILDSSMEPVPAGLPGELYIAGTGLARGYLNRPELTAGRFVPNPFSLVPGARLYRSGDVARYLPDGEIAFLGRNDHQVKIRGARVELGEVEAILEQHPSVAQAAVVDREDPGGNRRLVAWVVPLSGQELDWSELRLFAAAHMPPYMVPSAFAALPALPLTPSGKLDRSAFPDAGPDRASLKSDYLEPQTETEAVLAAIWAEVLGLQQVGVGHNFFELGGDSILSIGLVGRARKRGLLFDVADVFRYQTVRAIAPHVRVAAVPDGDLAAFALVGADDRRGLSADVEDAYPVSVLQHGLLFHSEYGTDYESYVTSVHVRAPFHRPSMDQALQRMLERHAILRTSFDLSRFSQPLQLVHRDASAAVEVHDLRMLPQSAQPAVVKEWLREEKGRRFDWSHYPLARVSVHLRLEDTFQVTLCEPFFDGWSAALFLAELLNVYASLTTQPDLPAPPPLASSYRDFVALELEALQSEECRNYWDVQLADCAPARLPRWWHAEANDGGVGRVQIVLPAVATQRLHQIAKQHGLPLKSVLLAAHVAVLAFLGDGPDVLTGLIVNGRPERLDGDKILGIHLNALPFRVNASSRSWIELARRVFEIERDALQWRRYPVAELQRQRDRCALFEAVFNFTHFHAYRHVREAAGVQILEGYASEQTYYPLTVQCNVDHATFAITLALDFARSEFPPEQIECYAGYYARALESFAENASTPPHLIELLSSAERHLLIRESNDTARPLLSACIHDLIGAQVARTPDRAAVICGTRRISYRDLDEEVNRLSRYLSKRGIAPESRVGVCLERTPRLIVAILAVLRAGGSYVAMDPHYPPERLQFMLQDSNASLVLTEEHLRPRLGGRTPEIVVDTEAIPIAAESSLALPGRARPENAAYVLYTSGSTGRPKGVVLEHRNASIFLHWVLEAFDADSLSAVLASTSICFDPSVLEFFAPLISGGAIVLADNALQLPSLPPAVSVKLLSTVPSAAAELLRLGYIPAGIQTVTLAGEPVPQSLVDEIYDKWSVDRVFNLYGLTELTTYSTVSLLVRGAPHAPRIGRPVSNTQVYVLNWQQRPAALGQPGELFIGGAGVSRGYLDQPALTGERFVPDPFGGVPGGRLYRTGDRARMLANGELEFLGRLDRQEKIRGFRVEPGETESVLAAHPEVREAAVLGRESANGNGRELVAYVVPLADTGLTEFELRRYAAELLPKQQLPSAYVLLDALPLNASGKVDRSRLPAPNSSRTSSAVPFVPASDAVEAGILSVLEELMDRRPIGVADNFFELGGHSLLATRAVSRLRAAFDIDLPLPAFFEAETVGALADVIRAMLAETAEPALWGPAEAVGAGIARPGVREPAEGAAYGHARPEETN